VSERLAAVCARELVSQARKNGQIWCLDGDLADSYGATQFADALPERFIMSGIAEQNMVSMAAGMAACGLRPWLFSFAAFLVYRAADQVRVCLSQTGLPVTLVGSHAGGCGGRNGKTHQSIGDLAVMGTMAGIDIWTPCDPLDVFHAMDAAAQASRPSYIRTPRDPCESLSGTAGDLRWLTDPSDYVLACSGLSAHWAMEARRAVADVGINLSVLHVGRFQPLPRSLPMLISSAKRWYVVEDHLRTGGLDDRISQVIGRHANAWFGWPTGWTGGSGSSSELRESCLLGSQQIAGTIAADVRGVA